jgi:hypothetical protein
MASIFIDSFAEVSPHKIGISPVSVSKGGLSQNTSTEVSARQDGTIEHSTSTIFLSKDRSLQVSIGQVGSDKLSINQIGSSEVGTSQVTILQVSPTQPSLTQIRISKDSSLQVPAQINPAKVNSAKVNSFPVTTTTLEQSVIHGEISNSLGVKSDVFTSIEISRHSSFPTLTALYSSALEQWKNFKDSFNFNIEIKDLPTGQLADTQITEFDRQGTPIAGTLTLDVDGNGLGWYLDPTPEDHTEYATALTPTAFKATPGSPAYGLLNSHGGIAQ